MSQIKIIIDKAWGCGRVAVYEYLLHNSSPYWISCVPQVNKYDKQKSPHSINRAHEHTQSLDVLSQDSTNIPQTVSKMKSGPHCEVSVMG